MHGFQTAITISEALININSCKYVLPSFQREFIWEREQIENLFDSLMRNYPTGSMLLWKINGDTPHSQKFYRFLDSYVSGCRNHFNLNTEYRHMGTNDYYAVLDGQQRLTALRIGLMGYSYAVHEKNKSRDYSLESFPNARLYLRLSYNDAYANGQNEYECMYIFKFKKDDETNQAQVFTDSEGNKWFNVSHIREYAQQDTLDNYLDENNFRKEERKILRRLRQLVFDDTILNYYLEDSQEMDRAVNIFIRINYGGSPLTFSDIIFSLIVGHWTVVDARTEFKTLSTAVANLGFRIDKDFIIRAFLFLFSKDIKLSAQNFPADFCLALETNWSSISNAIKNLFGLLKKYGLSESTLTSTNATLPILYYIYHRNIYSSFATAVAYQTDREIVQKWLYKMIVLKPFGAHTDSTLAQIRSAFEFSTDNASSSTWKIEQNLSISAYPSATIMGRITSLPDLTDEYIVEEVLGTQKDNKYAFPILALLYPQLDYSNENNYHKDHMHPDSKYAELPDSIKGEVSYTRYNSIINLQMLNLNDNTSKKAKSLKEWVDASTSDMTPEAKKSFFEDHIIPQDVDLCLNNVEEFFNKREVLLSQKLKAILS